MQLQATTASQLAALRFKGLLDYADEMPDSELRRLTRRSRKKLVGNGTNSIQNIIRRRNEERKKMDLLPYRYMQPMELTSSIAI